VTGGTRGAVTGGTRGAVTGCVRRATRRDRDRVVELWLGLLAHHAPLDPHYRVRPGSEGEWRRLVERLLNSSDAAVFVWEEAGALLGFCTAQVEEAPQVLVERSRAELTDLMVEPRARRRGIGRALVEAGAQWIRAQGAERTTVRVASHNPEAQAFWRALGFGDFMDVLQRRG
jgi:ribosomal protein S18 acetylase RimI-like enzyme